METKQYVTQEGVTEEVVCAICGSGDVQEFRDGTLHLNLVPPLKVVRCQQCRLLFMSPRPSADARHKIFSGEKPPGLEPYLESLAQYGSVTKTRLPMFRLRVAFLRQRFGFTSAVKVLDVGASSGEFLMAAQEIGWQAIGVEPSSDGVRAGVVKGLNMIQAPAEKLPFPDETFDIVHSNHVFEHLADPQRAAQEVFRVLKKNGGVMIEVPNQFDNINFLRYRLLRRVPVRGRNIRSIHHLYFMSRHSMRNLLANAGFKEIDVEDVYGRRRQGIAQFGSDIMRLLGSLFLGGPIIRGFARKRQ